MDNGGLASFDLGVKADERNMAAVGVDNWRLLASWHMVVACRWIIVEVSLTPMSKGRQRCKSCCRWGGLWETEKALGWAAGWAVDEGTSDMVSER